MIYTSYFAAMRRMTNEQKSRCVCIALWPPKGVSIPTYSNLAPTRKILLGYKRYRNKARKAKGIIESKRGKLG